MTTLDAAIEAAFLKLLLDLIEIEDSFDQLAKLIQIVNLLYVSGSNDHQSLLKAIENTAMALRGKPSIGRSEANIRQYPNDFPKGKTCYSWGGRRNG